MFRVVIFGYNFPHIKSEDFINILKKNRIKVSAYIGADYVKLNLPKKIYKKKISKKPIFHPKELCKIYNIPFFKSVHNSSNTIKIIKKTRANLGIISGARILDSNIIKILKYGVVNFHPGKIPEASGLDGLMWSVKKNIKPYVTTHLINEKIDSGKRIFQREVKVYMNDEIEDIISRMNLIELEELEKLCKIYLFKGVEISSKTILKYKSFNKPMKKSLQIKVLSKFNSWKKNFLCK